MAFDEIIGKRVLGLAKGADDRIAFVTNEGAYVYEAWGDCCNSVWFEHADDPDVFLNATVLDVDSHGFEVLEDDDFYVLEHWFIKVKTTLGYCNIELRNSHNGYYGGYVEFIAVEPTEDWTNAIVMGDW